MKEILDQPESGFPDPSRQKYFGYFAAMAIVVLVITIVLIQLGAGGTRGSFLHTYVYPVILTINCISTVVALVSSVFGLAYKEPDTGRLILCLLFSLLAGLLWMIALFGYAAGLGN